MPVLDTPADYIGLNESSMPPELLDEGGFVVGEILSTEYSVQIVQQGNIMMLWLERMICRDDEGKAYWEIRDVLLLPALRENEELILSNCTSNGEFSTEIVAVGEFIPGVDNPTKIVYGWRVDLYNESFEQLFPDRITCDLTNVGPGGP